jgi:hypothetical protein
MVSSLEAPQHDTNDATMFRVMSSLIFAVYDVTLNRPGNSFQTGKFFALVFAVLCGDIDFAATKALPGGEYGFVRSPDRAFLIVVF